MSLSRLFARIPRPNPVAYSTTLTAYRHSSTTTNKQFEPHPASPATSKGDATLSSSSAATPPAPSKAEQQRTRAQKDADAIKRFEERFGGSETTQLGELVDGVPQGMQAGVKKNLFRLI